VDSGTPAKDEGTAEAGRIHKKRDAKAPRFLYEGKNEEQRTAN
jgi:hypothetical protein